MSFDLPSLRAAVMAHGQVARVLVLETRGSTPRETGTSMLVWKDGEAGTIGGGELEFQAIGIARDRLASSAARVDRMALGPSLGQCCGGAVTLLTEVFTHDNLPEPNPVFMRSVEAEGSAPLSFSKHTHAIASASRLKSAVFEDGWIIEPMTREQPALWIYGAGHVGRAIVRVLAPLDRFALTWIDSDLERFPEDAETFSGVDILPVVDPGLSVARAPVDAHHIILTRSHDWDFDLCHRLLGHGFASVGLIGSGTKWARFRSRLQQLGHETAKIDAITCPIGDPALGKEPQAIAIGVAAGLLKSVGKMRGEGEIAI